ncbi:MAG: hypothetical protein JWO43_25 [Candidatus Adlerbacteria bacterium]|nr:hypothetical protein [Candidatus Adlerbacteria bacterium]
MKVEQFSDATHTKVELFMRAYAQKPKHSDEVYRQNWLGIMRERGNDAICAIVDEFDKTKTSSITLRDYKGAAFSERYIDNLAAAFEGKAAEHLSTQWLRTYAVPVALAQSIQTTLTSGEGLAWRQMADQAA